MLCNDIFARANIIESSITRANMSLVKFVYLVATEIIFFMGRFSSIVIVKGFTTSLNIEERLHAIERGGSKKI